MSNYWQKHNTRKLEPEDVLLIRELRKEGLTLQAIADKFDVTKTNVCKIVNKKIWSHLNEDNNRVGRDARRI